MLTGIFKTRLRDLREEKQITIEQAAQIFNMHKNTYWRYETDESPMTIQIALKFADYFDVSLDYLTRRTNFRKIPEQKDEVKFAKAIHRAYKTFMEGK